MIKQSKIRRRKKKRNLRSAVNELSNKDVNKNLSSGDKKKCLDHNWECNGAFNSDESSDENQTSSCDSSNDLMDIESDTQKGKESSVSELNCNKACFEHATNDGKQAVFSNDYNSTFKHLNV